jgi:hypothetical protein
MTRDSEETDCRIPTRGRLVREDMDARAKFENKMSRLVEERGGGGCRYRFRSGVRA